MKIKNAAICLMAVGISLAWVILTSCDDDKPNPTQTVITNIHTFGLPKSIGDDAFKSDDQGRLTGINQVSNPDNMTTELEYGTFTVPDQEGEFQVKIKSGIGFWLPMYVRLNSRGFAEYAYMPQAPVVGGPANLPFSYDYEYNNDGQLTRYVSHNLRGNVQNLNNVTEIEYVDGDIVSVLYNGNKLLDAGYTDSITTTPIPNITGFMDLDSYKIGGIYEQALFYAGLLGNAPRHLPLKISEQYNWVIDKQKRPIEFYEVIKTPRVTKIIW